MGWLDGLAVSWVLDMLWVGQAYLSQSFTWGWFGGLAVGWVVDVLRVGQSYI